MTREDKRYLRKRRQIEKILLDTPVKYESWRDEIYIETNMDSVQAKEAAEKILEKFGLNKPSSLKFY